MSLLVGFNMAEAIRYVTVYAPNRQLLVHDGRRLG